MGAGGQGLNLTGADTVIMHDLDFNPQVGPHRLTYSLQSTGLGHVQAPEPGCCRLAPSIAFEEVCCIIMLARTREWPHFLLGNGRSVQPL